MLLWKFQEESREKFSPTFKERERERENTYAAPLAPPLPSFTEKLLQLSPLGPSRAHTYEEQINLKADNL